MTDDPQQMTTVREKLAAYKRLIDEAVQAYCDRLLVDCEREYTEYSRVATEAYCSVLRRGGKRMRGALVMNAYEMLGGTDKQVSLRAAVAIEMMHAYLLVTDDICDRSLTRRGGPTAHVLLADYHRTHHLHGDSAHFGISQALNAALLGSHLAQLELIKLPLNDTVKLELLHDLNEVLAVTIHGQFNDIFNEAVQTVNEAQVRNVLRWKTAYYSFLNPLQVGAGLAQADPAEFGILKDYADHMGLAFQIADDILGTFGNEADSGKSTEDDLKEGKITILVTRALERATSEQRQTILATLGDDQLRAKDYDLCKQVIEDTGALDYARQLADQHAHKAVVSLDAVPFSWDASGVAFLRDLASIVTNRST